jgi:hypothetical protein
MYELPATKQGAMNVIAPPKDDLSIGKTSGQFSTRARTFWPGR